MTKDTAPLDPVDVAIGARIRTRREAARMTQAELAKHAGVTFQQVQKYERGQNRVAAARLLQIAEALRTTGADLLGELDDGGPDGLALATPGANALLTAFRTIESPDTRNAVLAIVMSLANDRLASLRIPFRPARDFQKAAH